MAGKNTKLMVRNLGLQIVLYFATFIFGIVISRIVLLIYGSEINGLISSINQFISYINLVELGLTSSAVYALYKPLADGNNNLVNDVLSATRSYYRKTGYVFLSLVGVLCLTYPLFTATEVTTPLETAYLVLVLGATGVINYFISAKYRILLIADQKQYILALISILSLVLNTLFVYVFGYLLHYPITILRTICILTSLIPAIIITLYAKYTYKDIKFDNRKVSTDLIKDRYVVFVNEIAGNLHFGSPVVILTFVVNLLEVSVYSVYNVVCNGISNLLNCIVIPISSSIGSLLAKKDYNTFKRVYNEFEAPFYILSAAVFALSLKVVLPFVLIYTNGVQDVNYNRPTLLVLFIINMFICNLYNPHAILVRATGSFKEVQPQTLIQATITVLLGIPLSFMLGIRGIVVASICANLYRSIAMIHFFNRRLPGVESKKTAFSIILSVFTFIIILITLRFSDGILGAECNSFIAWFVYSMKSAIISLFVAIFILILFQRNTVYSLFKRFL